MLDLAAACAAVTKFSNRCYPSAAITIDTYAAIRNLQDAGAVPKLAEAIVASVCCADTKLATKSDLSSLEGRLTAADCYLALGVVIANSVIVFGLLKLLMPA